MRAWRTVDRFLDVALACLLFVPAVFHASQVFDGSNPAPTLALCSVFLGLGCCFWIGLRTLPRVQKLAANTAMRQDLALTYMTASEVLRLGLLRPMFRACWIFLLCIPYWFFTLLIFIDEVEGWAPIYAGILFLTTVVPLMGIIQICISRSGKIFRPDNSQAAILRIVLMGIGFSALWLCSCAFVVFIFTALSMLGQVVVGVAVILTYLAFTIMFANYRREWRKACEMLYRFE